MLLDADVTYGAKPELRGLSALREYLNNGHKAGRKHFESDNPEENIGGSTDTTVDEFGQDFQEPNALDSAGMEEDSLVPKSCRNIHLCESNFLQQIKWKRNSH